MLPIRSIAQARCIKARNQRFAMGMSLLFVLLVAYSLLAPKPLVGSKRDTHTTAGQ